jgi:hypothetical protein
MGKIEPVTPEVLLVYIIYGNTDRPLFLFKGTREQAEQMAQNVYPQRAPFRVVEAVDCTQSDVAFVVNLAHADFICTQFTLLAGATARVQPVMPGRLIKH